MSSTAAIAVCHKTRCLQKQPWSDAERKEIHSEVWCSKHAWCYLVFACVRREFLLEIRAKEIEERLLTACKEDLLEIAEYEKPEEINTEQQ